MQKLHNYIKNAYLVEGAKFTRTEEYPILEKEMITEDIPKKIITFKESKSIKDLSEYYICFYEPDAEFERVIRFPHLYVDKFKKCAGIIGPDCSPFEDMMIYKQKHQMGLNLEVTYYYGKQGIKIIPNIRLGVDELNDEYLECFPKGTLIAIGTHGFIKYRFQKYNMYLYLLKIIERLNPSGIIIYGTLNGEIFDELKKKVPIYCYESLIDRRVKEVRHGDERA